MLLSVSFVYQYSFKTMGTRGAHYKILEQKIQMKLYIYKFISLANSMQKLIPHKKATNLRILTHRYHIQLLRLGRFSSNKKVISYINFVFKMCSGSLNLKNSQIYDKNSNDHGTLKPFQLNYSNMGYWQVN